MKRKWFIVRSRLAAVVAVVFLGVTSVALSFGLVHDEASPVAGADGKLLITNPDGTLEGAMAEIPEDGGVPIRVIWNDLAAVGIPRDMPLSIKFARPVTAEMALTLIVADLNGSRAPTAPRVDFRLRNGEIQVATRKFLDCDMYVDAYAIPDLNWVAQTEPGKPRVPSLEEVVMLAVEPDSWRDFKGSDVRGDMAALYLTRGQLVVTTTPQNHAKVKEVLSRLKKLVSP